MGNLLLDDDSSESSDSDHKNESQISLPSFGSLAGSVVIFKIKKKNLAAKFVEFSDLLLQSNLWQ